MDAQSGHVPKLLQHELTFDGRRRRKRLVDQRRIEVHIRRHWS
jgi:hypothetical protein